MKALTAALLSVLLVLVSCDSVEVPTSGTSTINPPGVVTQVTIQPTTFTLFVGGSMKLTATPRDAQGNFVSGTTIAWSSSDATVATVGSDGTVRATKAGTVSVEAIAGSVRGTASGTVQVPPAGSGDVVVNPSVTYQTMRGWEATGQAANLLQSWPLFRDELLDRAVNELGLNRIRIATTSGAEADADYYGQWVAGQIDDATWRCKRSPTVNDNNDPFNINWNGFHFSRIDQAVTDLIRPMQQLLRARGEELHINFQYVSFKFSQCGTGWPYHHFDAEEYAEFVLAHFLYLRNTYGLVPDSFELLLEPNNTLWWTRGRDLSRALVAVHARLTANGFNPRIIAPSVAFANMTNQYLDQWDDAGLDLIDELAYHRYDGPSNSTIAAIKARADAHGAETSMLEHIGSDQRNLYSDLVHAHVSSWQQFALAWWDGNGPPYNTGGDEYYIVDVSNAAAPKVILTDKARMLSQYFNYVRMGAQRVGATSSRSGVDATAFVNPTGKFVVVANVTGAKSFTVGGLPAGIYEIRRTTNSVLQENAGSVTISSGQEIPVSMPSTGVVTVFQR